jgi:hypothetical protein
MYLAPQGMDIPNSFAERKQDSMSATIVIMSDSSAVGQYGT